MRPEECIAFMLIQDGQVLAEKRKATKRVAPGAIALPGGHIEDRESPEEALHRECRKKSASYPSISCTFALSSIGRKNSASSTILP
jgi:ADP-ribose pyrophosphatase YjhB (NUDIX family)